MFADLATSVLRGRADGSEDRNPGVLARPGNVWLSASWGGCGALITWENGDDEARPESDFERLGLVFQIPLGYLTKLRYQIRCAYNI